MALITTEDLENAKIDVTDLGEFVNNDQVVTTRTGATYDSLRRIVKNISTTAKGYVTEAALLADLTPANSTLAYALDTEKFYVKSGVSGSGSWLGGVYSSLKGDNILYDSWNKRTHNNLDLGGHHWYGGVTPAFTFSKVNIDTDSPKIALTGSTGSSLSKWHSFEKLNLKPGDVVTVAVLAWSASQSLRVNVMIRDDATGTANFTSSGSFNSVAGLKILTNQFTVPAIPNKDWLTIQVQASSSTNFEIAAYSAAIGNLTASFTEISDVDYDKEVMGIPTIETNALASKTKTDLITVTQPINLDEVGGENPNIFPDVFGDTITNVKGISIYDTARPAFTNRLSSSANNPYPNKASLQGVGTANVWRYIKYDDLGIRNGEDFKVRVQAHYAGTGSITIDLRNSSGTVLQTFNQSPVSSGVASLVDYVSPAFQGRSDAYEILVRVQSSGGNNRELIAVAIGKGLSSPAILNAPNSVNTLREVSHAKNLCPDPFFRRYNAGETAIDGYTLGTTAWTMVDYTASPFKVRKAQFFNTNTLSERLINVQRMGLKLGKKYKVGFGVIAPTGNNMGIAVYFRNTDTGVTYGGTGDSDYTLSNGIYAEVYETITITQEMLDNPTVLVVRHNTNALPFEEGYYICGWFIYDNIDQELIDDEFAFDTLASIVTTLENSLTELPYTYNRHALRELRQFIGKRLLGDAKQNRLLFDGTSTTQKASRYITDTVTILTLAYGDGGGGYLSFASTNVTLTSGNNGNARPSIYTYARTGTWTSNYTGASTIDLGTVESSTAGSRITLGGPAGTPLLSGIDLHWVATANGVIRYSWNNGGAWTTLNVQGTVGQTNITALTGFPTSGNYTLWIEVVSGSVILGGVNIKSNDSGVVVHKIGKSGGRLFQLAEVNNTEWVKALQNLNPTTYFLFHGGNDQDYGRTPIQFANDLRTVIDRIKLALPSCDISIIMPPAVVEPRDTPLILYTIEAFKVAKEKKVHFMDLQKVFGETPSEYEFGSTRPWFDDDDIHPNDIEGGPAITKAITTEIMY